MSVPSYGVYGVICFVLLCFGKVSWRFEILFPQACTIEERKQINSVLRPFHRHNSSCIISIEHFEIGKYESIFTGF